MNQSCPCSLFFAKTNEKDACFRAPQSSYLPQSCAKEKSSDYWWFPINCSWLKICYMQHMYSTVVEHFVTQQWFKHYVAYHFESCIWTCRKRCWEKLYNVNLRYCDCWRMMVRVLVVTVHFSLYQLFRSESIHVSELHIAMEASHGCIILLLCMNSAWYVVDL